MLIPLTMHTRRYKSSADSNVKKNIEEYHNILTMLS